MYLFSCRLTIRDQIIPCAVTQFTGKAALEDKTKISAQHSNFLDNLGKNARKCVESLRLIQVLFSIALKFIVVVWDIVLFNLICFHALLFSVEIALQISNQQLA